ncbi:MAG: hypothetical protein ACUVV0_01335 [Anaerolineae bacterium]
MAQQKKISTGLRATFLIHLIIGGIFGLIYLLIPDLFGSWIGWPVKEMTLYRVLGAAILGYAFSSYLAYRETAWESVRIVVLAEIAWTILGVIAMAYGMIVLALPAVGWAFVVVLGAFAVAFIAFYSPK